MEKKAVFSERSVKNKHTFTSGFHLLFWIELELRKLFLRRGNNLLEQRGELNPRTTMFLSAFRTWVTRV